MKKKKEFQKCDKIIVGFFLRVLTKYFLFQES